MMDDFEIVGLIEATETIAVNNSIRDIRRLRRNYGQGRWRKLKGIATVRLSSGELRRAEIHWYEAHGIGRKELRIKHYRS